MESMSDSDKDDSLTRWVFHPVLLGALAGASFYYIIALGLMWNCFGKDGWFLPEGRTDAYYIGRVMSDWISMLSMVAFAIAMALLLSRRRQIQCETAAFSLNLMGDDPDTFLLPEDARSHRNELRDLDGLSRKLILVRMLENGLQRARASWSSEDVSSAIHSTAEIIRDEIEATYSTTLYLAWAIPSLGFVGTVLGIGQAMSSLKFSGSGGSDSGGSPMDAAASHLSTAFDTTMVALVLSLVLMYLLHTVQSEDDRLLARAKDWVLSRLPLRMHTVLESPL
jgi:biopolymer transport protein ExbB/TolQ